MRTISLLLLGGLLLSSSNAVAQGTAPGSTTEGRPAVSASGHDRARVTDAERDSSAYCAWVRAVADSTSDPLVAPSLYVSGGYTSPADASPGASATNASPGGSSADAAGASALPPTQRLTAAGFYSFGSLNRGLAMRAQADAECKRYATTADLRAFVELNRDAESVRALKAKAKVLDESLAKADEILAQQKAQLAAARLTVEEIGGTQIRADALRALAAQTHQQIEALAAAPPMPKHSYKQALAERDVAEENAERKDGRLRAAQGWDVVLRGGYDQVFGYRDNVPVFAMATVTLNLGWFFQGSHNADALAARRRWVRDEVEGLDDRVEQVAQRLRAARDGDTARLRETNALAADLEARYKSVNQIAGDKARTYADYVWFDLVRVEADRAYFAEHLRELSEVLGDGGGS
jgi:hypothetical protein